MSDKTPLEAEATGDSTTFEKFGREWTVPTKQRHSHIITTKQILRAEGSVDADDITRIYLPDEEYAELLKLDVTSDDLSDMADEIAKAMGLSKSGNS